MVLSQILLLILLLFVVRNAPSLFAKRYRKRCWVERVRVILNVPNLHTRPSRIRCWEGVLLKCILRADLVTMGKQDGVLRQTGFILPQLFALFKAVAGGDTGH